MPTGPRTHRQTINANQPKRTRSRPTVRPYNRRSWRKLSRMVRGANPICQRCGTEFATEVHHINGDNTDNDVENLEAICQRCHGRLTATENGGFGNPKC